MARFEKYQTKKGERWMFIVENGVNPQTGNRSRIVRRGFKKQKDAKDAARDLEYQLGMRKLDLKSQMTFKEMAEEWLDIYSERKVKISTIRIRKHEIGHLNEYLALYPIRNITKKNYQGMLKSLKKEGLAHQTISGIHGTGRMIFKRALEQDIIVQDPTQFAYIPEDKQTVEDIENRDIKDKYLEKHELKDFLKEAANPSRPRDTYAIFFVLSWTGLRVGELLALKWRDIDFDNHTISITKTYYNPTNNTKKYQLLPPKTEGSIRVIDIEEDVVKVLKSHKALQNEIKLESGSDYYDKGFVFGRFNAPYFGYPHFIKTVENRMAAIMKKLSIDKHLTPHSLRHTHTSLMAEAGVELLRIMDRLGHTDDETTTEVYLHITKDRKKEASHKFGELMRSLEN